ncbi:MAG: CDP-alcohol phosphatidyltransferase family protein [Anaerolineaceae bacterium]|nr:CDP-alcohol phosphatidyltransferase family protein [Anaerolineaceae bacterium]
MSEKKDGKIRPHERIMNHLLAPLERPAIDWLVRRMPLWVTSDLLTWIGIFASVVIFVGYSLTVFHKGFLWLASFGFILNWFGDSLDGNIARYRRLERPRYGFFLDHTVDSVSEALVFLGLGLSPYFSFEIAQFLLIGYLMLSIYVYITTYVKGEFQLSYAKLGPTEMRAIGIILNTLIFFFFQDDWRFTVFGRDYTYFDPVAMILAIAEIVAYLVSMIRQASALQKLDEARLRERYAEEGLEYPEPPNPLKILEKKQAERALKAKKKKKDQRGVIRA